MGSGANDIQLRELRDTILQLNNTIKMQNTLMQKQHEDMIAQLEKKDQTIANLTAQLEFLKTKLFGSTSEKNKIEIPGQLSIFDLGAEEEKPAVTIEPEVIEVAAHKRERKSKATYDELFENIKTTRKELDPLPLSERTCPECKSVMVPIGKEVVRTEIIYHKASIERIEYVATSYRCPNALKEADTIIVQDKCNIPALIQGSYVSASLASQVMYAKYAMGLPLYRQEQDFKHLGASIGRGTMANWIITCSKKYLEPVYKHLHKQLLKRTHLMADETPLQVLNEPERRAQSKSYIWVVRTGEADKKPIILFNYTETRKGANAADFLNGAPEGFYLMTDGYKGYNQIKNVNRCACWAHVRRYWLNAIPKGHERDYEHPAVQGFLYCDKLFSYERQYKEKGLSALQTYKRRLKDQEPVIDAFLSWIDGLRPKTGDAIIKAIGYTNGCRPYLKTYLKDGGCSLSNNLSENAIRPVVLGRKNWLFCDTQDGADASAVIFSLIETAKANEINPHAYLNYLLEKRPYTKMTEQELEQFMPWNKSVLKKCSDEI